MGVHVVRILVLWRLHWVLLFMETAKSLWQSGLLQEGKKGPPPNRKSTWEELLSGAEGQIEVARHPDRCWGDWFKV